MEVDVVIVGAGAAGLMCAAEAGKRGRRVLVLEHNAEPGAKILISGGGRCNFTHLGTTAAQFWSSNPHFCKSALGRYRPADFVRLVERHGIAYHEKTPGQLFCDGSARAIVDMLVGEARAAGAALWLGTRALGVSKDGYFTLETSQGSVRAHSLVLASGGLSIPKLGASGFAFEVARQFGLGVIAPRAALVPLVLGEAERALLAPLAGVSFDCVASIGRIRFEGPALVTHKGLSGPAILQISTPWAEAVAQSGTGAGVISLNLAPKLDLATQLLARKAARGRGEVQSALAEILPARFSTAWASARNVAGLRLADMADRALRELAAGLSDWRITPAGSEGYAKAEVTAGGIDTKCLDGRTMMAPAVPGLFAIGEAVDVTGWLGGYNFQWAWSSGWVAGQVV